MHGGAEGSGAPHQNTNAKKHGFYSAAAAAERRVLRAVLNETRKRLRGED